MLPGILLLAIVGWRDDRIPVSSLVRLLVQLAVSLWLLGFGWFQFSWFQFSLGNAGLFAVTILAMVWMMNLYNFMDGSDGMAGFQGVFAGVMMAVFFQTNGQYAMALLALLVATACASTTKFPACARVHGRCGQCAPGLYICLAGGIWNTDRKSEFASSNSDHVGVYC